MKQVLVVCVTERININEAETYKDQIEARLGIEVVVLAAANAVLVEVPE
jgi:hypothetical protein